MSRIQTPAIEAATGATAEVFAEIKKVAGKVALAHKGLPLAKNVARRSPETGWAASLVLQTGYISINSI